MMCVHRVCVCVHVQGVEPDKYTRQAMESAGAAAAMLKIGGILGTFSSRFKSRLAEAVFFFKGQTNCSIFFWALLKPSPTRCWSFLLYVSFFLMVSFLCMSLSLSLSLVDHVPLCRIACGTHTKMQCQKRPSTVSKETYALSVFPAPAPVISGVCTPLHARSF